METSLSFQGTTGSGPISWISLWFFHLGTPGAEGDAGVLFWPALMSKTPSSQAHHRALRGNPRRLSSPQRLQQMLQMLQLFVASVAPEPSTEAEAQHSLDTPCSRCAAAETSAVVAGVKVCP
ncbi:unnamed protein product [Symbiodinium natans]|uniref:Uncharacterized protein n=1 Tax=Symbiodinium natans TaxID=878477 RepID=A0A812L6T2_9DINO|nr:unnamed protein product [Symbiodinium natans]